jgi:two-component system NtrC family sensor kinase
LLRALRGERFQATELVVVSPGRPERTLLVSGEPMLDAAGNRIGAVIAAHDITERKRADDELLRQREALHQSEKLGALSGLVAGVAHELNNPLSVVLGQSELLLRAAGEGPLAPRAEKIRQAAERCGRIVRNFLALARHQPRERQRVQLNRVVVETLEIVGYALEVDGIEVVLSLDEAVPTLWADPHQLQQVLLNLLGNAQHALRAMPERAIVLATTFDPASNQVLLTVRDSGPGIALDRQRRIFEPFFTTKPEGEGTGLGLSLCQGIIGEHGGAIRVESELGHGACFVVELPVAPARPPEAAASAAPPAVVGSRAILVVDDEPMVRELLQEILAAEGHRVEIATTGRAALDMIRRGGFDVVFADLKMPDMDGRVLYDEVERIDPSLARRFVLMTGDTLGPESRGFLEMSGVMTVAKPFDLPGVAHTLRRLLARPNP